MMNIRPATYDDIPVLIKYTDVAAAGMIEFLLDGLVPSFTYHYLLKNLIADTSTSLSYENFIVAETEEGILGAAAAYPSEQHVLDERMSMLIPKKRVDHFREYFEALPTSFYISILGTSNDKISKSGRVTVKLMSKLCDLARERGFEQLTFHVWEQNKDFMQIIDRLGAKRLKTITIEPHPKFHYEGNLVLFATDIPSSA